MHKYEMDSGPWMHIGSAASSNDKQVTDDLATLEHGRRVLMSLENLRKVCQNHWVWIISWSP